MSPLEIVAIIYILLTVLYLWLGAMLCAAWWGTIYREQVAGHDMPSPRWWLLVLFWPFILFDPKDHVFKETT